MAFLWQLLCDHGSAPSDMTLDDFAFSDACAVTTEELDDGAIIQCVTDTGMEDNDSDQQLQVDCSMAIPKQVVIGLLDLLSTYMGTHSKE